MRGQSANSRNILGAMKPSRAIVKLAVPATLALLAKAVYNIVDTAYIGMLGSEKKVHAIFSQLEKEGIAKESLQQIYAPIGLDLGGETPEELAVAIVAEMLAVKYGREGKSLSR